MTVRNAQAQLRIAEDQADAWRGDAQAEPFWRLQAVNARSRLNLALDALWRDLMAEEDSGRG